MGKRQQGRAAKGDAPGLENREAGSNDLVFVAWLGGYEKNFIHRLRRLRRFCKRREGKKYPQGQHFSIDRGIA
jgi:hypothetical protein